VRSGHVGLTVSAGTFRGAGQYGYDWNTITTTPVKRRWLFIDKNRAY